MHNLLLYFGRLFLWKQSLPAEQHSGALCLTEWDRTAKTTWSKAWFLLYPGISAFTTADSYGDQTACLGSPV